jgi:hypothetical protein
MKNETASAVPVSLSRRLTAYALAAGAAGVGMAALVAPDKLDAGPAGSTIVYTPAEILVGDRGVGKIDLNHDGIDDIRFEVRRYSNGYYGGYRMYARPADGNQALRIPRVQSAFIGPSIKSFHGHMYALAEIGASCKYYCPPFPWHGVGQWAEVHNAYMGVRFQINGETHYGWVRMNVVSGPTDTINITITGYAYNTVANQGLFAGVPGTPQPSSPHPASLGALSVGAQGLAVWRREATAGEEGDR